MLLPFVLNMASSAFHFKKFSVYQEGVTHPVGTDGVLLGAWAEIGEARSILDIGTGTGLIALMAAQRSRPDTRVLGIDIHGPSLACAAQNAASSPWADRVAMREISLQALAAEAVGSFDLIISNPPFFSELTRSPDDTRNLGRHTATLSLQELMAGAAAVLAPGGRFCVILPEKEGKKLIEWGALSGLFVTREVQVRSRPAKPVERLLLQFEHDPTTFSRDTWSIHAEGGGYSLEYRSLTETFYL